MNKIALLFLFQNLKSYTSKGIKILLNNNSSFCKLNKFYQYITISYMKCISLVKYGKVFEGLYLFAKYRTFIIVRKPYAVDKEN